MNRYIRRIELTVNDTTFSLQLVMSCDELFHFIVYGSNLLFTTSLYTPKGRLRKITSLQVKCTILIYHFSDLTIINHLSVLSNILKALLNQFRVDGGLCYVTIGKQVSFIINKESGASKVSTVLPYLVYVVSEVGQRTVLFNARKVKMVSIGQRSVIIKFVEYQYDSRSLFLIHRLRSGRSVVTSS